MKSDIYNNEFLSQSEQCALTDCQQQQSRILESMQQWKERDAMPLFCLPPQQEDLPEIQQRADEIRATNKGLLVLGTGGSSLGGQTLCELSDGSFPVVFLDNVDPYTIAHYLQDEYAKDYHLLMISKSGGTLETLSQAQVLLQAKSKHVTMEEMGKHATVITMPGDRALRQLGEHYNLPVMDHDSNLGGRFSVLSNVGLLPAAVAGVDIIAIRRGSAKALAQCEQKPDERFAGVCWQAALMDTRVNNVMMPYCDRLRRFSDWFKQLWAESLGKDGKGSNPCNALGAVDQHSQLQLWLDGPTDKTFTIVTVDYDRNMPLPAPAFSGYDYLQGKDMADILQALQHGTIETIKRHKLPLRIISLPKLDGEVLGELLMQFMIETVATAVLMQVDPYDQPAVEDSKNLARENLQQGTHKAA